MPWQGRESLRGVQRGYDPRSSCCHDIISCFNDNAEIWQPVTSKGDPRRKNYDLLIFIRNAASPGVVADKEEEEEGVVVPGKELKSLCLLLNVRESLCQPRP